MQKPFSLETYLAGWACRCDERRAVADAVLAIAAAARQIADIVALGPLAGIVGKVVDAGGRDGAQKDLDVRANDILVEALRRAPVAYVASEEGDHAIALNPDAPLSVAIDPLDGSSNIDTNTAIGTIFSILATARAANGSPDSVFYQPGRAQLAAGYVIYGPQTALVLTVGKGTLIFTLDRRDGTFAISRPAVSVPAETSEYAINGSNARHWSAAIKAYVADCIAGTEGPRHRNFNTRWLASMVGEAHRILMRGGVYLYPADARKGYEQGRLRLVYEAAPIAFLLEQAGGSATDGRNAILDLKPRSLHQRVPLVFGSREEVELIAQYKTKGPDVAERPALFSSRGLYR